MIHEDTPAALPLLSLIAGLGLAPLLVNRNACILAMLAVALLLRSRRSSLPLFAALGLALAPAPVVAPPFDPERFVVVEVPLDRDWSERNGSYVARAPRFTLGDREVRATIAVVARFEPPPIGLAKTLRAEGFLRQDERGGYVLLVKSPRLLSYDGTIDRRLPSSWNRMLANRLATHAHEHRDEVALAEALLLGRGEHLSDEMRAAFRRGGTYHLLVFSGLQIAFAAAVLALLLRWLHAPRLADWLLLAFAALAPPFIGATASVSRASLGIGLYALARLARRPTSVENVWAVAALLRLIVAPRDLGDAAFHLTYAGAGALLFIGKRLHGPRWLRYAVAAEATMTPLVLFHFHQYALGGSLLTLVLSPVIFAMLAVSALACAFPCDALFACIGALHQLCVFVNRFGVSGYYARPPLVALLFAGCAALIVVARLREQRRAYVLLALALVPSIAAVAVSRSRRSVEHPRVTFFDVGQGDAIAVRSGAHTLLVDGGPDTRVLPLLADRGIRRIDAIVLTHAHPDHCGALPDVVRQLDVGAVWVSPRRFTGDCALALLEACSATRTPLHLVRDGTILHSGNVTTTALLPSLTFRHSPENNASVVLRVSADKRTFLLTGDIEREAELDLLDRDLHADVLKTAHHGSRSSTSEALLEAVRPRIAAISCGRRNVFGHPHPAVLARLQERRVRVWRTDTEGTIDVEVERGKLYVRGQMD
ncbi:MAG TPA: DNA internalization-related competence protein ComEC/Rec2 [Thermoanaerobaculia bacterium]